MQGRDENIAPDKTETTPPDKATWPTKLHPHDLVVEDAVERQREIHEKDVIDSETRSDDFERLETAINPASPADADTSRAPSDAAQLQEATLRLEQMEAIRPDRWNQLSETERLDAVKQVEAQMADIQNRPPVELRMTQMEPGKFGGFDRAAGLINISETALQSSDVAENVDTVIHEGRHAYQAFAIKTPGFHSDPQQVQAWADNFDHYKSARMYGQEEYVKQPLEADAWAYAGKIRQSVFASKER